MKNMIITLLAIFISTHAFTQDISSYRIYGEISTIENKTYKGYITWNQNKNYWIDFFQASKIENPYKYLFKSSDGLIFRVNNREFATPPIHNFCCRFGNIKSIRPTAENEILLQLKNGDELHLTKGNSSDINTNIQINTPTESITLRWDHISEINLMSADKGAIVPESNQAAGSLTSSQGIYKGLIYWNNHQKQSQEKMNTINTYLNKLQKITIVKSRNGNYAFDLLAIEQEPNPFCVNSSILSPMENVMINMPNIGSVCVHWAQFKELTLIPLSELNLLSYDDFPLPQTIKGEVITHTGDVFSGTLAYDLDESYEFEILDGKNNNITYSIPFRYIRSIEPKNYKYSFITLRNGSGISLGETCDVNRDNNGIIVFREGQSPVYIQWSEIKKVNLQ